MLRKLLIFMLFSFLVGCVSNPNIYLDGMPVSDHEYTAVTKDGFRTSFILSRYYEKKFDDETMRYPEYMDLFEKENEIDMEETEQLILHIKIVNIKRTPIIVWWILDGPSIDLYRVLYSGKLPRKDLFIQLPIAEIGKYSYDVVFAANEEELFSIWGEYKIVKGGKKESSKSAD